jgi:hypothetical protein
MPDIYKSARGTVVYLGEEEDDSSRALEMMKIYYTDYMSSGIRTRPELRTPMELHPRSQRPLPPRGDEQWECVRKFFLRPWFHRVWIVQEFIVSQEVCIICGNWEGHWSEIWAATLGFEGLDRPYLEGLRSEFGPDTKIDVVKTGSNLFQSLGEYRLQHKEGERRTLFMLLQMFRGTQATIARDHYQAWR